MMLMVMVGSRLDGLDHFSKLCFLRCSSSALPWKPSPLLLLFLLTLAKGTVGNPQLFQRSNVQAEEAELKGSSSTSLYPASSHAIFTATCSWYAKHLRHAVNGRTAFLFSFELQLKNVGLVGPPYKIALQCPEKEQEFCPQPQTLSFVSSRCTAHSSGCRCRGTGVEEIK